MNTLVYALTNKWKAAKLIECWSYYCVKPRVLAVVHDPNKQNKTNACHKKCPPWTNRENTSIKGRVYSPAMTLKQHFLAHIWYHLKSLNCRTKWFFPTVLLMSPPKAPLLMFNQLDNCSLAQGIVCQWTINIRNKLASSKMQKMKSWQADKFTSCMTDGWQDDKMTRWQDDKMTR